MNEKTVELLKDILEYMESVDEKGMFNRHEEDILKERIKEIIEGEKS